MWYPGGYADERVYETQAEYLERVRDTILDTFLPRIRNLSMDGEVRSERELVNAARLYRPDSLSNHSLTTIATFNLASNRRGPVATESVFTHGAPQVYATENSMYLFAQKPYDWSANIYTQSTQIWKFDFEGGRNGIKLAARGAVEGFVLNQFAADEENGYLRVVTESFAASGHGLHVLRQVGKELEVVGSIDGIAASDRLYSVRFVGNRAYFVTFRQIDPLFAVDLSDPTNPQLLGELHIPGYSDYLQPIDENHLLAIGRGADETTGLFEELQVSIFDVSDVTNPRLVHRYSFGGGRTTATPATGDRWARGDGDHHAVSYFADEQILALPIFTADNWLSDGGTLFSPGEGGLQLFKIDVETGFTPLGIIEHDTPVKRSVRIGDRLYAISSGTVTVHDLADPVAPLGEVDIAGPPATATSEVTTELVVTSLVLPLRVAEPEAPLPPDDEDPLAAFWNESAELEADPIPAAESKPAPLVGWAPLSQAHARRAQPATFSGRTPSGVAAHLDSQLLDLLVVQNTGRPSIRDAAIFELAGSDRSMDETDVARHKNDFSLSLPTFDVFDFEL
jgi:hypothetical protein